MCPERFLGGLMVLSPQEIGACDLCCDVCICPYNTTGLSLCRCKSFVQCAAGVFNDTQLSSRCHSFCRILCAREMTDYHVDMGGVPSGTPILSPAGEVSLSPPTSLLSDAGSI